DDHNSPQASASTNPNAHHAANSAEFLTYSNPTNVPSFYVTKIWKTNGDVAIELPKFLVRRVTVDTSTDLSLTDPWLRWQVPGNDGIALAPGLTNTLTAPITGPKRFFKIRVEE